MESESTRVEHLTLLLLMDTQILGGPYKLTRNKHYSLFLLHRRWYGIVSPGVDLIKLF
jgi:hypothetical protein